VKVATSRLRPVSGSKFRPWLR